MLSNMTSEPLNGSAAQTEDQAEDTEQLWHVFDLVAVRIILFVTYSVVFVFCFFGEKGRSNLGIMHIFEAKSSV